MDTYGVISIITVIQYRQKLHIHAQ